MIRKRSTGAKVPMRVVELEYHWRNGKLVGYKAKPFTIETMQTDKAA